MAGSFLPYHRPSPWPWQVSSHRLDQSQAFALVKAQFGATRAPLHCGIIFSCSAMQNSSHSAIGCVAGCPIDDDDVQLLEHGSIPMRTLSNTDVIVNLVLHSYFSAVHEESQFSRGVPRTLVQAAIAYHHQHCQFYWPKTGLPIINYIKQLYPAGAPAASETIPSGDPKLKGTPPNRSHKNFWTAGYAFWTTNKIYPGIQLRDRPAELTAEERQMYNSITGSTWQPLTIEQLLQSSSDAALKQSVKMSNPPANANKGIAIAPQQMAASRTGKPHFPHCSCLTFHMYSALAVCHLHCTVAHSFSFSPSFSQAQVPIYFCFAQHDRNYHPVFSPSCQFLFITFLNHGASACFLQQQAPHLRHFRWYRFMPDTQLLLPQSSQRRSRHQQPRFSQMR